MPDNQKKKKSFSGKIRMYMLVSGAIIILAVSGISCAIMKGYLITQIKSRVAEIAEIAASMVDGDMHKQLKPGDEDTEAYMKIHSDLSLFLGGDFVQYVYTMSETEDGQIQFIVDTDEEEGSDIGEIYDEAFDEMYEALGGKVTTDSDITEDEWGQFLSGYAPIYDSEENVVGFVGVDCLAESVDAECMGFIKKMIFVGIACLIFAFFISMVPSLALKKRLDELNSKLEDVVYNDGDLSRRVVLNTGDEFEEVADNLNAMLDQTRTMVESVKDCSLKLQNVAVDVDSTMDDAKCKVGMIAGYLDDMAGSIEVTVSSLEEISSMMDEVSVAVSDMSENSRTGADTAMEISRRSVDMTRNAQNSKEELAEHIERISGELEMMLDRAKAVDEIQSFTEDILEIASQTRLLSLNASIEAARAGEMGKGFAVVAQNIGELAENSGNAASNIQLVSRQVLTLVNEMSELSKQMLDFMQENILVEFGRLTESGDRYAKDATNINSIMSEFIEKMNMIDIAISDVKKAVDVVSEASVTNNEHITEVSHFADELDRQMGHTANMSQQNKSQADNLSGIVDRYSV